MSPLQAIRKKCLDCSNGRAHEVKHCPITKCPLYEYRSGKTGRKKDLTDEQRKELAERMKRNLEQSNSNRPID